MRHNNNNHNKDDKIETQTPLSAPMITSYPILWWAWAVCLAVCLMLQSAVLIDELTNQVTTECNGVPLYFKKMYINKRNKHV